MSALEVKDKLTEALKTGEYDWIVVNFANSDMVGHTGVYTAIETAVTTIDQCLNPFIYVTENKSAKVQSGVLADVAPSILHIMGLEQPKEMTGKCLISDK